jgi:hypothetical protein
MTKIDKKSPLSGVNLQKEAQIVNQETHLIYFLLTLNDLQIISLKGQS